MSDLKRPALRGLAVLLCSAASISPAFAQENGAPRDQGAQATEDGPATSDGIVVTGTRIVRDGYAQPTPVTVITSEVLNSQRTSATIADALTTLPVFANSTVPSTINTALSTGLQGLAAINLRGAGAVRTLVMLDGQRLSPSIPSGPVDINNIPQQLVQRVDIVTGGVSAVYGSDAVTGVVNFILDKKFTGLKAEVGGGITDYGDDASWNAMATFGKSFAGGRGHFLISGEIAKNEGIYYGTGGRKWAENFAGAVLANPGWTATNGQPFYTVYNNATVSDATLGGIITSGPLRGTAFGPGGTPYQFQYGSVVSGNFTAGANIVPQQLRYYRSASMDPPLTRHSFFTRASFDLTERINAYAQFAYSDLASRTIALPNQFVGNGPVIRSGNPFIPASVQAAMTAQNIATIQIGTFNDDLGSILANQERSSYRYNAGLDGSFDIGGQSWRWNLYGAYGLSRNTSYSNQNMIRARYTQAVDAVRNANGTIICRSTVTNPNDGCVPYNVFGIGVNSRAAIDYVTPPQGGFRFDRVSQTYYGATITGEPFSTWAGPVGIALNGERRVETLLTRGDPFGEANAFFSLNTGAAKASNSVTEGSAEVSVPLARELPFAYAWEVTGAYRATDYRNSGFVSTWKLGTSFSPVPDIRFRVTRSRDIRAPALAELFAVGFITSATQVFDPLANNGAGGNLTVPQVLNGGNDKLTPEIANTLEAGVVLQPEFIPGFRASLDFWKIDISNAIGALNSNQVLLLCSQGNVNACAGVVRNGAGALTQVSQLAVNLATQKLKGIDIEASYSLPLDKLSASMGGTLNFNVNATHYITSLTDSGIPGDPAIEGVGQIGGNQPIFQNDGPPRWVIVGRVNYAAGSFSTTLTGRWRSSGVRENIWTECASACPANSRLTVNDNSVPGAFFMDLAFSRKFDIGSAQSEVFVNIRNIFNTDPPTIAYGPAGNWATKNATFPNQYDQLGRVYRVGLRVKM